MASQPRPRVQSLKGEFICLLIAVASLGFYGGIACFQLWRAGKYHGDFTHYHDYGFYGVIYAFLILVNLAAAIVILLRIRRKLKAFLPPAVLSWSTSTIPLGE